MTHLESKLTLLSSEFLTLALLAEDGDVVGTPEAQSELDRIEDYLKRCRAAILRARGR